MSANVVANVFVSGTTTASNVVAQGVYQNIGAETITAASATLNPYVPSVLRPLPPQYSTFIGNGGNCTTTAVDSSGNMYVTGSYSASAPVPIYNLDSTFSGYNLPIVAAQSAFLIKYNSSGVYQYSTVLSVPSGYLGLGEGVACDSSGNVYWTGRASGGPAIYNMTANPNTSSTGYVVVNSGQVYWYGFLIKYGSSGSYVSSTTIAGGNSFNNGFGVTCDSSGNVYMTGTYGNTPTLYNLTANPNTSSSGYSLPNYGGGYSAVLYKWNSSGTYQGATAFPNTGFSQGNSVACDSSGNIYWSSLFLLSSGYTLTLYNLTANPNSSSTGVSVSGTGNFLSIIIKYNSSGTYQYCTTLGTTNSQGYGVTCDTGGNVYWTGFYNNSPTLYNLTSSPNTSSSGYALPNTSGTNWPFLIKYNSGGTYQYSTALNTGTSGGVGQFIACDAGGNVFWSGYYYNNPTLFNMTANPNTSSAGYSLNNAPYSSYLISYTTTGTYQYSTTIIGYASGGGTGNGVACDPSGKLYWCGKYYSNPSLYNLSPNPSVSGTATSILSNSINGAGYVIKYTIAPVTSLYTTLPNLGVSQTNVVEKPIYLTSGVATNIIENSNVWAISAGANVAAATWTTDRWVITADAQITCPQPLYSFTTATFTPGGATGRYGPTVSQARSGLSGTPAPSNWYSTYLNMTTQGFQLWTVPVTWTYTITVAGAAGFYPGGYGMITTGTFILTQGEVLTILVGQAGDGQAGGGGGTFVVRSPYGIGNCLIVAGGGGGKWNNSGGDPATSGQSGTSGSCAGVCGTVSGKGGVNGGGGGGGSAGSGSGGGGFLGNGGQGVAGSYCCGGGAGGNGTNGSDANCGSYSNSDSVGRSYTNGAIGGLRYDTGGNSFSSGGFGGGGGAIQWNLSGGGGGGYSGGGGGGYNSGCTGGAHEGGGGGGSINTGTNQSFNATNSGTGYVIITRN